MRAKRARDRVDFEQTLYEVCTGVNAWFDSTNEVDEFVADLAKAGLKIVPIRKPGT